MAVPKRPIRDNNARVLLRQRYFRDSVCAQSIPATRRDEACESDGPFALTNHIH